MQKYSDWLLEAVSMNKAFLTKEAGSHEQFEEIKKQVNEWFTKHHLDQFVNPKEKEKLLPFLQLYLIRDEGFLTDDLALAIHDIAVVNKLTTMVLQKSNSDTRPDEFKSLLNGAVKKEQNPNNLTPEEKEIWERVVVYHDFGDGYKWVYAVDENGNKVGAMPGNISSKMMRHCGNVPSEQHGDEYWELRDYKNNGYLTIIINDKLISESKSKGNQKNTNSKGISKYVMWLMKSPIIEGVGKRYDCGVMSSNNYGARDVAIHHPGFLEWVYENKPKLIGKTEALIMCFQNAVKVGGLTVEEIKSWYYDKISYTNLPSEYKEYFNEGRNFIFGDNPWEVCNAIFGKCLFNEQEIITLINEDKISLPEFINSDINLLTEKVQIAFFKKAPGTNTKYLIEISVQVLKFYICPKILKVIIMKCSNLLNVRYYNRLPDVKANTIRKQVEYIKHSMKEAKIKKIQNMLFEVRKQLKKLK